jgi:hypothetical protein
MKLSQNYEGKAAEKQRQALSAEVLASSTKDQLLEHVIRDE